MISLKLPSGEVSYYLIHNSWTASTLGPFSEDGEDHQGLQYRPASDFIETSKSIFGENNVDHVKTSGELYINPLSSVPNRRSPTQSYPWRREYYINGRWETSFNGIISGGRSLKTTEGSRVYLQQWTGSMRKLTKYSLHISRSNYGKHEKIGRFSECSIQRVTCEVLSIDPKTKTAMARTTSLTAQLGQTKTYDNPTNWSALTERNLSAMFSRNTHTYSPWTSTSKVNVVPIKNVWSKQTSMDAVSLMMSHFERMNSPHHISYGDLAMKASDKIASNQANMFEFISELRNPKQLIPKLKNLGKLKNAAENFLTLNYGILPTISDLKEIFGAFSKAKYYDKNNFSVVTSVETIHVEEELNRNQVSIRRLKLAVGDNDSYLESILTRMENMGVLPTFANLWDLIPYSFVIDWFVDIGGLLERIDSKLRLDRLNIQYATTSSKRELGVSSNVLSNEVIVGDLKRVHYSRWTTNHSPVPSLLPQFKPSIQNHWLEAGALIIANRK